MTAHHRTVAVTTLRTILRHAGALGLDVEHVLTTARVPAEALADVDGRVALDRFDAIVVAIERLSHDPLFGLRVGTEAATEDLGCIHYLVHNSDTFGQCLERLAGHARLINDGVSFALEREGDEAWGRLSIFQGEARPAEVIRHHAAAWLASVVRLGRKMVGEEFHVTRVLLPPQCDRDNAAYREVLGTRPELAFDRPSVAFPARFLDAPIPNADPHLSRVMTSHASRLLEGLPRIDDLRDTVSQAIERELADSTVNLERVARRLAMSSRSLQRRLRDEGLGFRELVDELRRGRAREYLKNESMSVDETAFLLGFSNASAFGRACRRWTHLSPREYRSRLLSEMNAV